MAIVPRRRYSFLGADFAPTNTRWTHPADRYSLITAPFANMPITVNATIHPELMATDPIGARTLIPGMANVGRYVDNGSGEIVDKAVVDAWLAANNAAQTANPTATQEQIQATLSSPVATRVEVFDPTGKVLGTVPLKSDGTYDASAVGPGPANAAEASRLANKSQPITSPGVVPVAPVVPQVTTDHAAPAPSSSGGNTIIGSSAGNFDPFVSSSGRGDGAVSMPAPDGGTSKLLLLGAAAIAALFLLRK